MGHFAELGEKSLGGLQVLVESWSEFIELVCHHGAARVVGVELTMFGDKAPIQGIPNFAPRTLPIVAHP